MSCSHYNEKTDCCKNGFRVSTGCVASGKLEENYINYVECGNEELVGRLYFDRGGKPPTEKELEEKWAK